MYIHSDTDWSKVTSSDDMCVCVRMCDSDAYGHILICIYLIYMYAHTDTYTHMTNYDGNNFGVNFTKCISVEMMRGSCFL